MKSLALGLFLFFFLCINFPQTIFATEASPEVHSQSVQKERKSFKEKLISKWIQKKGEKIQRKQSKRRKGQPIDAYIGFGLSVFAYLFCIVFFVVALITFITAPFSSLFLIDFLFLTPIAAGVGGLLGLFADLRLSKKENASRTGKVFAKLAWILGFAFLTGLLIILLLN